MISPANLPTPSFGIDQLPAGLAIGLGQTHLPPWATLAIAAPFLLIGLWYWRRLGRSAVIPVRRRIRRFSLLMGGVATIATVMATGWIDPDVRPISYLSGWAVVMVTLFALVVCAVIDAIVSIRLHQRMVDRRLVRDTLRLRGAIERSAGNDSGEGPRNA
ncbi:hypothetical protein OAL71_02500 [Phycisphaerales bacterium]|nr:hypothetical protein [Rhodopirellula sp.]MDC0429427.1 hypothetical protein [Phycisphaerales bacterium]